MTKPIKFQYRGHEITLTLSDMVMVDDMAGMIIPKMVQEEDPHWEINAGGTPEKSYSMVEAIDACIDTLDEIGLHRPHGEHPTHGNCECDECGEWDKEQEET